MKINLKNLGGVFVAGLSLFVIGCTPQSPVVVYQEPSVIVHHQPSVVYIQRSQRS